jgi:hypothetical protein
VWVTPDLLNSNMPILDCCCMPLQFWNQLLKLFKHNFVRDEGSCCDIIFCAQNQCFSVEVILLLFVSLSIIHYITHSLYSYIVMISYYLVFSLITISSQPELNSSFASIGLILWRNTSSCLKFEWASTINSISLWVIR